MLSQLANLQGFMNSKLADVISWQHHVRPATDLLVKSWLEKDYQRETTGDQAYIAIKTKFNRFWMSSLGAYVEPPAGAPLECRSLGTIEFVDFNSDKPFNFIGPRNDATFYTISEHIRRRELVENIKDTRRELAENTTPALRSRMEQLLIQAKEKGIDVKGIDLPQESFPKTLEEQAQTARREDLPLSSISTSTKDPVGLYIGCPVLYITNPGEHISGMYEIPGVVTKMHGNGRIAGIFFPDHSDVMHKDYVYHRAGSIKHNCWDFNIEYQAHVAAMSDRYANLDQRVIALEGGVVEQAVAAGMKKLAQRISEMDAATGITVSALRERLDKLAENVLDLATRPQSVPSDVALEQSRAKQRK